MDIDFQSDQFKAFQSAFNYAVKRPASTNPRANVRIKYAYRRAVRLGILEHSTDQPVTIAVPDTGELWQPTFSGQELAMYSPHLPEEERFTLSASPGLLAPDAMAVAAQGIGDGRFAELVKNMVDWLSQPENQEKILDLLKFVIGLIALFASLLLCVASAMSAGTFSTGSMSWV